MCKREGLKIECMCKKRKIKNFICIKEGEIFENIVYV